ncbi:MAG: glycoside hydrolase family 2 protein [Oscillospiraceae bacterium]|nr:glycoside hydrolase family 2 protein [Oscillospiraceae bacterium]
MISLCNDWSFTPEWSEAFLAGEASAPATPVRLPHNAFDLPLHYASEQTYSHICGYRRALDIPVEWAEKRLFLQFDGAAHIATVFVNGEEVDTHRCGYTAFRVEITDRVRFGEQNQIAVRLDATENPTIPPFGYVVDYLTYSGLYREVWLDVRADRYISDIFVHTPTVNAAKTAVEVDGVRPDDRLEVRILDDAGNCVAAAEGLETLMTGLKVRAWSPEDPNRYTLEVRLFSAEGVELDVQRVRFGFRTVDFRAEGCFINGQKVFLRGLNRHQSWPHLGYAAPEHLQREDARILKEELQCTAVRTSHYPQSQYFIDECDRLGLLVFTEIPGWQHIGDEAWQEQACENTREMIRQWRNHPSIILWGVRINESVDNDPLYTRTNAIAHALDPSRPTSGVRYLEKSSLLEDVYSFNDFSHDGTPPGCKPKKAVTPDVNKALIISECNGHMFPTKSFDPWEKRQEHALRHARVQDAALADGEHAGCFGWCMFDYQTHKDFGSGDRICYHGVMDSFRNPKLAASLYASQGDAAPVLEVGSSMDIGDYPAGQIGTTWVFTNADEVRLYKNDVFVTTLRPAQDWKGLRHGPMPVDDTIGELLETQEGFDKKKAALLRRCLLSAGKHGMANLPAADKARMGYAMLHYHMSYEDGYALYGKYVGNWGGSATAWRFDAVKDGEVVASALRQPATQLHLEVTVSQTRLTEGDRYDMAALRVRILDANGTVAPYAQLPVRLTLTGAAELIGPDVITAEGGMTGAYLRTIGQTGAAQLTVACDGLSPVSVDFVIES